MIELILIGVLTGATIILYLRTDNLLKLHEINYESINILQKEIDMQRHVQSVQNNNIHELCQGLGIFEVLEERNTFH